MLPPWVEKGRIYSIKQFYLHMKYHYICDQWTPSYSIPVYDKHPSETFNCELTGYRTRLIIPLHLQFPNGFNIYLSLYLYICLYIYLSICISICLSVSVYLSVYVCVCLSLTCSQSLSYPGGCLWAQIRVPFHPSRFLTLQVRAVDPRRLDRAEPRTRRVAHPLRDLR